MKALYLLLPMLITVSLFCKNNQTRSTESKIHNAAVMKLKITIGIKVFPVTLYNNATTTAFKARLPMTIDMKELNGNEKYFNLPDNLPTNASNPKTIKPGDLMIYGADTLVIFYKTFSTPYNYTPLGRIDNPVGLAAALGSGSVTVTFEAEK